MNKQIFKNDRYKKNRGGSSKILEIACVKCGAAICKYQKDGPGSLRRMYVDRIIDPIISIHSKALVCPKGHMLGVLVIYEKEDRPAFRVIAEAVAKKISK